MRSIFLTLFMFFAGISLVGCDWFAKGEPEEGIPEEGVDAGLGCVQGESKSVICSKEETVEGQSDPKVTKHRVTFTTFDKDKDGKTGCTVVYTLKPWAATVTADQVENCNNQAECKTGYDAWIEKKTGEGFSCNN